MVDRTVSASRGIRLALLAGFLCLLAVSPSLSASTSLRSRIKPSEVVEESVAFDEEATNRGPAKNVPIKAHGHSPEAEGSESEATGSESEGGEEAEQGESAQDAEDGEKSEAEEPEAAESEAEAAPPKGKKPPPAPSWPAQTKSSAETAAESAAASTAESKGESTAESKGASTAESTAESAEEKPGAPKPAGPAGAAPQPTEALAPGVPKAGAPVTGAPQAPQVKASNLPEAQGVSTETEMAQEVKPHKVPKEQQRSLERHAVNERLTALGAPFTLGREHFSVDFKHGFKLAASDFESLAAKSQGVLWRAVADEPRILSEKTLFLTVDIDDMFIGTDVRLVQLFAKPEACTVEAEGACKVEWFLRDPSPASPAHRIIILGFSSPSGAKFEFDDLFKRIQQKPTDIDLRRVSLSRFFDAHSKFFNDENGNFAATPSWHAFALVNHGPGEGEQSQFDQPLVELPPNATEAQKAEVLRIAKETHEEVDGLTTPQHGGESPGAGGRVDASTIFKYVLGSLLIIGLVVGVAVSVCSCAKPAS